MWVTERDETFTFKPFEISEIISVVRLDNQYDVIPVFHAAYHSDQSLVIKVAFFISAYEITNHNAHNPYRLE